MYYSLLYKIAKIIQWNLIYKIGKTPHLIDVETEVALRLIPRTNVKVTGEKNEKGAFHFFRVAYPVIKPCK